MDNTKIPTVEPRWLVGRGSGGKEVICIRATKPSLNKDGGWFNLSPISTNILKDRVNVTRAEGAICVSVNIWNIHTGYG